MIAEYNVNLENKTKSELILFIKELQDILKEKDKLYHKALGDLVKADRENIQLKKQIDLMAERIEWLCKSNGILLDKEHDENFTQEDIKKYFERKVRDERN